MMVGLAGENATAILPSSPLSDAISTLFQLFPASVVRYNPLPGPPDLKVYAFLWKSHIPAYKIFGLEGSIVRSAHPVPLLTKRIFSQVFPPSIVLKTPRPSFVA